MEKQQETPMKKDFIVKRISSSKFEVYDASEPLSEKTGAGKPKHEEQSPEVLTRKSVIQRAPPAQRDDLNKADNLTPNKRRRTCNTPAPDGSSSGVILIKDAIMYRIVDILMWKVMGEDQLKNFGYPVASTCQVLWRVLCHNQQNLGAREMQPEYLNKDHDCGGNVACFTTHVYQFLEVCAPNLWRKTGWERLTVEELLRRIYYEDLIPYLRSLQLKNDMNVLKCHSDIILLEKWEKQKFTAVTWEGQKYFSQISVYGPKCLQCKNRHF